MVMTEVLGLIVRERDRQERLRAEGKFSETCASITMSPHVKLAVLMEEVGEVATELCEPSRLSAVKLRNELIQVAAVCVAWLESMEGGSHT